MNKDLYSDNHPETSIKNTGYKNKQTSINTLKLIKNRSLRYQFDVINTMYNRAKYNKYLNQDMIEAMYVFAKWLNNYPNKKQNLDKKYKWLHLEQIIKYEHLIQEYDFDDITLKFYKKLKKISSVHELNYLLIDKQNPTYYDYNSYRIFMINKLMKKKDKYKLFKYNGNPTKYHLMMIMYGFSPVSNKI